MAEKKVGLRGVFETTQFERGVQIYTQNVKLVNQGAKDAEQQSSKSSRAMSDAWEKSFASIAKKAVAVVASFLAVQKASQFMKQTTLLAARVETLGVALETVGKNAGYSKSEIAGFEKAVKAQGITTQASRQILLTMAQAQIDWAHATDLARIAQDAAVIADTNSSDAAQRLTFIIQTGNVRMARTLGLQVSFQKGYERMAAQLDKTTDELTEQERVQARVNVVLEAGTLIAGTYTAAMQTAGKLMNSLNRLFEETQLAIGQVNLGGFAIGIDEITRLVKDLLKWMEENEEQLDDLGLAVEQLVGVMVTFADLDLPVEQLTDFIDKLTTLASMLAVGIETVKDFRTENTLLSQSLNNTLTVLGALNKFAAWPLTVMDAVIDKFTELRKADEDLFKTQEQLRKEREAAIDAIVEKEGERRRAYVDGLEAMKERAAAEAAAEAERLAELAEMREKAAEQLQTYLDRITDMQRAHDRRLLDMAGDQAVRQERARAKYGQSIGKEIAKGRKNLEKLEAEYQKRRVKAIAAYTKRVVEAEKDLARDVAKAQADFARREAQTRQNYELGRVQSERRYQFERARLVAEGDTLAIEQLDERHKLEQEEARENERLRQRQAKETQAVLVKAMREAGREQAVALAEALAEQLEELKEESREEADEQQQANAERLQEMADSFAEQQRMADEDYQRSIEKANLNYGRQQEELGRNLAKQEELQELGAGQVERLLGQYYGEGGISDRIMKGWHERENARILITAAMLEGMAMGLSAPELGALHAAGGAVGLQMGGILEGPAMAYVEPGIREAFVPLTGPGAGGAFTMEFLNALQVAGLGAAGPAETGTFLKEFTRELTRTIRTRRRS